MKRIEIHVVIGGREKISLSCVLLYGKFLTSAGRVARHDKSSELRVSTWVGNLQLRRLKEDRNKWKLDTIKTTIVICQSCNATTPMCTAPDGKEGQWNLHHRRSSPKSTARRSITQSLNTEPEEIEEQQQRIPLIVPSVVLPPHHFRYDGSREASGTIMY
eukprot:scaffold8958_cov78-Skeletonema_dohrnii-CCMP3373.AAC.1